MPYSHDDLVFNVKQGVRDLQNRLSLYPTDDSPESFAARYKRNPATVPEAVIGEMQYRDYRLLKRDGMRVMTPKQVGAFKNPELFPEDAVRGLNAVQLEAITTSWSTFSKEWLAAVSPDVWPDLPAGVLTRLGASINRVPAHAFATLKTAVIEDLASGQLWWLLSEQVNKLRVGGDTPSFSTRVMQGLSRDTISKLGDPQIRALTREGVATWDTIRFRALTERAIPLLADTVLAQIPPGCFGKKQTGALTVWQITKVLTRDQLRSLDLRNFSKAVFKSLPAETFGMFEASQFNLLSAQGKPPAFTPEVQRGIRADVLGGLRVGLLSNLDPELICYAWSPEQQIALAASGRLPQLPESFFRKIDPRVFVLWAPYMPACLIKSLPYSKFSEGLFTNLPARTIAAFEDDNDQWLVLRLTNGGESLNAEQLRAIRLEVLMLGLREIHPSALARLSVSVVNRIPTGGPFESIVGALPGEVLAQLDDERMAVLTAGGIRTFREDQLVRLRLDRLPARVLCGLESRSTGMFVAEQLNELPRIHPVLGSFESLSLPDLSRNAFAGLDDEHLSWIEGADFNLLSAEQLQGVPIERIAPRVVGEFDANTLRRLLGNGQISRMRSTQINALRFRGPNTRFTDEIAAGVSRGVFAGLDSGHLAVACRVQGVRHGFPLPKSLAGLREIPREAWEMIPDKTVFAELVRDSGIAEFRMLSFDRQAELQPYLSKAHIESMTNRELRALSEPLTPLQLEWIPDEMVPGLSSKFCVRNFGSMPERMYPLLKTRSLAKAYSKLSDAERVAIPTNRRALIDQCMRNPTWEEAPRGTMNRVMDAWVDMGERLRSGFPKFRHAIKDAVMGRLSRSATLSSGTDSGLSGDRSAGSELSRRTSFSKSSSTGSLENILKGGGSSRARRVSPVIEETLVRIGNEPWTGAADGLRIGALPKTRAEGAGAVPFLHKSNTLPPGMDAGFSHEPTAVAGSRSRAPLERSVSSSSSDLSFAEPVVHGAATPHASVPKAAPMGAFQYTLAGVGIIMGVVGLAEGVLALKDAILAKASKEDLLDDSLMVVGGAMMLAGGIIELIPGGAVAGFALNISGMAVSAGGSIDSSVRNYIRDVPDYVRNADLTWMSMMAIFPPFALLTAFVPSNRLTYNSELLRENSEKMEKNGYTRDAALYAYLSELDYGMSSWVREIDYSCGALDRVDRFLRKLDVGLTMTDGWFNGRAIGIDIDNRYSFAGQGGGYHDSAQEGLTIDFDHVDGAGKNGAVWEYIVALERARTELTELGRLRQDEDADAVAKGAGSRRTISIMPDIREVDYAGKLVAHGATGPAVFWSSGSPEGGCLCDALVDTGDYVTEGEATDWGFSIRAAPVVMQLVVAESEAIATNTPIAELAVKTAGEVAIRDMEAHADKGLVDGKNRHAEDFVNHAARSVTNKDYGDGVVATVRTALVAEGDASQGDRAADDAWWKAAQEARHATTENLLRELNLEGSVIYTDITVDDHATSDSRIYVADNTTEHLRAGVYGGCVTFKGGAGSNTYVITDTTADIVRVVGSTRWKIVGEDGHRSVEKLTPDSTRNTVNAGEVTAYRTAGDSLGDTVATRLKLDLSRYAGVDFILGSRHIATDFIESESARDPGFPAVYNLGYGGAAGGSMTLGGGLYEVTASGDEHISLGAGATAHVMVQSLEEHSETDASLATRFGEISGGYIRASEAASVALDYRLLREMKVTPADPALPDAPPALYSGLCLAITDSDGDFASAPKSGVRVTSSGRRYDTAAAAYGDILSENEYAYGVTQLATGDIDTTVDLKAGGFLKSLILGEATNCVSLAGTVGHDAPGGLLLSSGAGANEWRIADRAVATIVSTGKDSLKLSGEATLTLTENGAADIDATALTAAGTLAVTLNGSASHLTLAGEANHFVDIAHTSSTTDIDEVLRRVEGSATQTVLTLADVVASEVSLAISDAGILTIFETRGDGKDAIIHFKGEGAGDILSIAGHTPEGDNAAPSPEGYRLDSLIEAMASIAGAGMVERGALIRLDEVDGMASRTVHLATAA